jgi:hypothetical protein
MAYQLINTSAELLSQDTSNQAFLISLVFFQVPNEHLHVQAHKSNVVTIQLMVSAVRPKMAAI